MTMTIECRTLNKIKMKTERNNLQRNLDQISIGRINCMYFGTASEIGSLCYDITKNKIKLLTSAIKSLEMEIYNLNEKINN